MWPSVSNEAVMVFFSPWAPGAIFEMREDEILEYRTFGARIYSLRISRPDGRAYALAALAGLASPRMRQTGHQAFRSQVRRIV